MPTNFRDTNEGIVTLPGSHILGTGVYLVDVERGMCEGVECECRGFWEIQVSLEITIM